MNARLLLVTGLMVASCSETAAPTDASFDLVGSRDAGTDRSIPDAPGDLPLADDTLPDAGSADRSATEGPGADGSAAPLVAWVKQFGDTDDDTVEGLAIDSSGNLYFAGSFKGSINLGGATLSSAAGAYVASLTGAGAHRWSRAFGTDTTAGGIALDGSDNVYVAGGTSSDITIDGQTRSYSGGSGRDVYLVSLTGAAGAHRWARVDGSANSSAWATDVSVDSAGNAAVIGNFTGKLAFDKGMQLSCYYSRDVFAARFDTSGTSTFAKVLATGYVNIPHGAAVGSGPGDTTYVSGYAANTGGYLFFFRALDSSGATLWSSGSAAGYNQGNRIITDPAGNVYTVGQFSGTLSFGGTPITSTGLSDAFLVSHTPAGAVRLAQSWGHMGTDHAEAVALDSSGNIYVVGHFQGTVDFGGGPLTSSGDADVFVLSRTATNAHRFAYSFGGWGYDAPYGVAVDSAGDIYVAGEFEQTVAFGASSLTSKGLSDVFLVKISKP